MLRSRAASGRLVAVRGAIVTGLVAVAALTGGPTVAGGATGAAKQVVLRNIAFGPSTVRITVGQRVTWTWRDQYSSHNIHSVGRPRFAGATERRTGTHTVRFTRRGTYRYACTLHPGMNGKVVVG